MTYLKEDADERRMFDHQVKLMGGPLLAMAATLGVWHQMAPREGSYGKLLAIMANECRRAHTTGD